ncbi:hypothetical protein [Pantoea stewartii]|uniref:hypothetical protein n=1 Tax=Pantoea stewartii TaxID=66269 RepID=UPI00067D947E|nr:hypothetical protein [Pantoea stewartii]
MSAGTIALTNNSTTVNGSGTSFTTELKTGDFIYVTVGGAPYTLVAANITSDTQLTLAVAFDGPTTSGLAWNAVPASLNVAITQKILNDFASVARGRILDFQNWQKIYSDAQSVDVIRPDRTTFTGPSWGYMAKQYSSTLKSGDVGKSVASQTDSRFSTVDGKTGGVITGGVSIEGNNLNIRSKTRLADGLLFSLSWPGRVIMFPLRVFIRKIPAQLQSPQMLTELPNTQPLPQMAIFLCRATLPV